MKHAEEIIIGCWLRGDYLDTIQLFDVEDFESYPQIVRVIKRKDKSREPLGIMEVAAESETKTSILAEMYAGTEIDFYGCVMSLKRNRIKRIAEVGMMFTADSRRVEEQTDMLQKKFEGVELDETNLCIRYLEALDRCSMIEPTLSGIKKLDELLQGFRPGELTTLSARPGVGKSAFCLQVAVNAATHGKKVLFFALEMATKELVDRIVQGKTNIPGYKLKRGSKSFSEQDSAELMAIMDGDLGTFGNNAKIVTHIANVDVYKTIIQRVKPDIVIVDQLSNLKATNQSMQIRERFCYCTTTLKRIAVELEVPILLAAQLNRGAEGNRPTLADIKESGSIEEDSDNVLLLYKPKDESNDRFLELAKHRQGETGTLKLIFNGAKSKFYEVERWKTE